MTPLAIRAFTLVNALGRGVEASRSALLERRGGLRRGDFSDSVSDVWLGRIDGLEDEPLPEALARFECRTNRLAEIGLQQDDFRAQVARACTEHGANRIGVFLGTSTSGSVEVEPAFLDRDPPDGELPSSIVYEHSLSAMSLADYVRCRLGVSGPSVVVTTACSSSAKVFASACRHLQAGTCDAAVVGGVDSLCLSTLHGFRALGVVAEDACRPWDRNRGGMSIGEGAGFALLERLQATQSGLALLGYGESSDGYHMASPHPDGAGAILAMQQALASARCAAGDIDYVNLHGTGTRTNDETEDKAILKVFGAATACSSTKGWTGHTLGAAGITEALFSLLAICSQFVPGTLNTESLDPALSAGVLLQNRPHPVRNVLTNSFGFGGTNCSLIFGAV